MDKFSQYLQDMMRQKQAGQAGQVQGVGGPAGAPPMAGGPGGGPGGGGDQMGQMIKMALNRLGYRGQQAPMPGQTEQRLGAPVGAPNQPFVTQQMGSGPVNYSGDATVVPIGPDGTCPRGFQNIGGGKCSYYGQGN